MTTPYVKARNLVLMLLEDPTPTAERLQEEVRIAADQMEQRFPAVQIDRSALLRELESMLNVFQGDSEGLVNDEGHLPWLEERLYEVNWAFWERYVRFQSEVKGLPPVVLDRLDSSTQRVLGHLEDPHRTGPWDRRGMVVGQVQSGKTGNYTGLICKAADSGYRFIIVLTGMHNSLRSQTQLRLDEGLLGFNTTRQRYSRGDGAGEEPEIAMGVGALPGAPSPFSISLTTNADGGDFKKQAAAAVPFNFQGDLAGPVLLVVKKNVGILKNLREWLQDVVATGEPRRIRNDALLMIDDEADNASVNTKEIRDGSGAIDLDYDPTRVNEEIRKLINVFEKRAYVGYTATPFANIYIESYEHNELGKDLFPKSFIEYLKPPSNYFGPAALFGIGDREPLPLHRPSTGFDDWMPDRHKSSHRPDPAFFPESLRLAIRAFVLARATRLARGQLNEHNSMLIHVTRFQDVQRIVREQVDAEFEDLRARIRYGDGDLSPIRDELRDLWLGDFEPTTAKMELGDCIPITWDQVAAQLSDAVRPVVVKTINGSATDALDYYQMRREGLNAIVIGGDKLSRGLTLEGLTVSYYLRSSRTFDTLMQMGRWFGYRPGYADVCRLYTTRRLWECYREVTLANEELIADFEDMANRNRTPDDYGLKVRNSVQGMLVTAPGKMRAAQNLRIGFAGTISETVLLHAAKAPADSNFLTLEAFVSELGAAAPDSKGNFVWRGVDGLLVARNFFARYNSPDGAWRVNAPTIAQYVQKCCGIGELVEWTVVLISKKAAETRHSIGGLKVGLTERSVLSEQKDKITSEGTYSIHRILSPPDEYLDFTEDEIAELRRLTSEEWKKVRSDKRPTDPAGRIVRACRPPEQGLLLIYPLQPISPALVEEAKDGGMHLGEGPLVGFAASFPRSTQAEKVEYLANPRYLEELFSLDEDGESE